jgi:hypothetical protein
MKKWQILSVAIAASVALAAKPAFAILGPMPVIDVGPEQAVWNNQLIQQGLTEINTATTQIDAYQTLKLEIQNAIPTRFGWPLAGRGISMIEPLLQSAEQRLNRNRQTVQQQTGVVVPPDAATQSAEDGMDELAGDQNDLAAAENASDDAPGDLAAAQAGHRIDALQVSDGEKLRQFLYAQQLQKANDEADAEAWMTLPDGPEDY